MIEIKRCFEIKIASVNPTISTVYEDTSNFTPTVGVPYQELYFLPAGNEDEYINDTSYMSYGVFQITLKYPLLKNKDMIERAKLYLDTFARNTEMINNGIKVKARNTPTVRNLGKDADRLIYAISINYKAYY